MKSLKCTFYQVRIKCNSAKNVFQSRLTLVHLVKHGSKCRVAVHIRETLSSYQFKHVDPCVVIEAHPAYLGQQVRVQCPIAIHIHPLRRLLLCVRSDFPKTTHFLLTPCWSCEDRVCSSNLTARNQATSSIICLVFI